jgi:hypothetical protein
MKSSSWMPSSESCKSCGWNVVSCLVNWDTEKFLESKFSDWWCYCSNKACENHKGEELFQNELDWIDYGN